MILRLLLTLLNPYKHGRLPRRKDIWLRCRIIVFTFCVRRLQRRYRQYAHYDGINMGTMKIVQSCRDEIFESWLKSIGQDIRPHLSSSNMKTTNILAAIITVATLSACSEGTKVVY